MPYASTIEKYSKAAATPCFIGVGAYATLFEQVYSDIARATVNSSIEPFKIADLVGRLPTISHLGTSTQADIIRVVVRDMLLLPSDVDGLVRLGGSWRLKWRFAASGSAWKA